MDLYLPNLERTANDEATLQYFLSRIITPQLAKDEVARKFFSEFYEQKFKNANGKVLGLHPKFKTSLERNIIPGKSNAEIKENYIKSQEQKQKYVDFMLKMKPEQQAALSPHIQLYILPRKKNGKFENYKKRKIISFDKKTALSGYGRLPEFGKGDGAGIQNVTVSREYATANMFDPGVIKITYFFQSYQVFAEKVASAPKWHGLSTHDPDLRYTELIRPNSFRSNAPLVLEYGWNVADSVSDDIIARGMKEIINAEEKKVFVMDYAGHNFEFADDASIKLTVEYVGIGLDAFHKGTRLTTSFGNTKVNRLTMKKLKELAGVDKKAATLLGLYESVKRNKECIESQLQGRKCTRPPFDAPGMDKKQQKENINEIQGLIRQDRANIQAQYTQYFPAIFEAVLEDNLGIYDGTYSVNYTFKEKELQTAKVDFKVKYAGIEGGIELSRTATYDVKEVVKQLQEKIDKDPPVGDKLISTEGSQFLDKQIGKILRTSFGAFKKGGKKTFKFTTIRDIVMAIYRIADEDIKDGGVSDKGDVVKSILPYVMLGNILVALPDGQKYWCNIGDVFVDLKVFRLYLKAVLRKNKTIGAGTLISLLMRDLVSAVLYDGIDPTYQVPIKYQVYGYTGALSWNQSQEIIQGAEDPLKNSFALMISNEAHNRLIHYHAGPNNFYNNSDLMTPQTSTLFAQDVFNKTRNLDLGYYRVLIGAAAGLLKKVSFSPTENPHYQTLLLLLNSTNTNWLFAPYFYAANLTTFGNNVYGVAGIFNIPAANLGIEKEKEVGLSGFYLIKSVTDVITPNSYETNIAADRVCSMAEIENNKQAKKEQNKRYLQNITFNPWADVTLVKHLFNILSAEKTNINLYGVKINKA